MEILIGFVVGGLLGTVGGGFLGFHYGRTVEKTAQAVVAAVKAGG